MQAVLIEQVKGGDKRRIIIVYIDKLKREEKGEQRNIGKAANKTDTNGHHVWKIMIEKK